ncbi:MAG TPA: hypothetical protein VIJ86_04335 [Acidimicrobiales bacterium]
MSQAVYESIFASAPQPLVDRPCFDHWRNVIEPLDDRIIRRSAAIMIPSNPITPDGQMGTQIVAPMVVLDGATERLNSLSFELPVAS